MSTFIRSPITIFLLYCLTYMQAFPCFSAASTPAGLTLYYWQEPADFVNFGDYLSLKIVERMVEGPVKVFKKKPPRNEKKLLALGSLLYFAYENDVLWGTGMNGKTPNKSDYTFTHLDVRAVRGPITRKFLIEKFNIECPEIYGDPALLMPYLFPEFDKQEYPSNDYIVIPHFSEKKLFPRSEHIVYPTDPWDQVVRKILDSKFVISSSLHGIIVAEAYGIPARMLRVTENEFMTKYQDYYEGTNRPDFEFATSVEEALRMGGESPIICDVEKLYDAFPFDYWPQIKITKPDFHKT